MSDKIASYFTSLDLAHLPQLNPQLTQEELLQKGGGVPRSFYVLRGPINEIYWPTFRNGLFCASYYIYLSQPKDDDYEWVFPIKLIRNNGSYSIPDEAILRAVEQFETKNGWHEVALCGGSFPLAKEDE